MNLNRDRPPSLFADQPIGIFDSGIGGLTVLREIASRLPHEQLIYFGDTARLPYGNKSSDAIIRCSLECSAFLIEQKIKILIVACHTASTHALEILQEKLSVPVIGVIQPGFELLMEATQSQRVAVLGTSSTIASGVYQNLIHQHYPLAQVFPVACPLFVPLAEEHLFEHPAADLIAEHYLHPLKDAHIDAALLACTHYPLLKEPIQKALGPDVKIIEPAKSCSEQVYAYLFASQLLNRNEKKAENRFFVTDFPERFVKLAKIFLGQDIDLQWIRLEKNSKL